MLFSSGLSKLMEAEKAVSQLSDELLVKEKELAVASQRADEVLREVMAKAQAAEKVAEKHFYCQRAKTQINRHTVITDVFKGLLVC